VGAKWGRYVAGDTDGIGGISPCAGCGNGRALRQCEPSVAEQGVFGNQRAGGIGFLEHEISGIGPGDGDVSPRAEDFTVALSGAVLIAQRPIMSRIGRANRLEAASM
jgi:hypothetical protein